MTKIVLNCFNTRSTIEGMYFLQVCSTVKLGVLSRFQRVHGQIQGRPSCHQERQARGAVSVSTCTRANTRTPQLPPRETSSGCCLGFNVYTGKYKDAPAATKRDKLGVLSRFQRVHGQIQGRPSCHQERQARGAVSVSTCTRANTRTPQLPP